MAKFLMCFTVDRALNFIPAVCQGSVPVIYELIGDNRGTGEIVFLRTGNRQMKYKLRQSTTTTTTSTLLPLQKGGAMGG